MNKKVLIAAVAGVVLIAGGAAAYMLTRPEEGSADVANTEAVLSEGAGNDEHDHDHTSASIGEFLAAGENKKCTYSDNESTGTMYFASNQRLRMDYQHKVESESSGSAIITTDKQYVWSDSSKEGVMFAFSPEQMQGENQTSAGQNVDMNKQYDFTCEGWSVDEALFAAPADVKFTDFTTLPALPQR